MENSDSYQTLERPSEPSLYKEKGSKFFGYAYPVLNEESVKTHLENLKKEHHTARHWCYAYQLGTEKIIYRANDDGEPNNSAGMPIYGQIQSFDLTNVLVVVVRYFGGTKLGVGGLIQAYKTAAQLALESSSIVKRTIDKRIELKFEYKNMNKVMRLIKEHDLRIESQTMELDCRITLLIRKNNYARIFQIFKSQFEVSVKEL